MSLNKTGPNTENIYIYIYIYVCVCVCVYVVLIFWKGNFNNFDSRLQSDVSS